MFASLGTRVNTVDLARKLLLCELNGGHSHSRLAVRGVCGHGMSTPVAIQYMQVTISADSRAGGLCDGEGQVGSIRTFREGERSDMADRRGSALGQLVFGE